MGFKDFVDIPGYEGLYAVNIKGDVLSYPKNWRNKETKLLTPRLHTNGYLRVQLSKNKQKKDFYIHRLVALTFLPNLDNYKQINHKDLNKKNNNISNLEWCNSSYNQSHGFKNGARERDFYKKISLKGQGLRKYKLDCQRAERIRYLYENCEYTQVELGKMYGVSKTSVQEILKNRRYINAG